MFGVIFLLCLNHVFACDDKEFSGNSGVINAFSQKSHPSAVCYYKIRTPPSTRVRLRWRRFNVEGDMPGCYGDYVKVRVGCGRSQQAGEFCSGKMNTLPHDIYSRDGCIRILYSKSKSGGFEAEFTSTAVGTPLANSCNKVQYINTLPAVIASPGWPNKIYSASCKWKIRIGMKKKEILLNIMDLNGYSYESDYCYYKGSLDITTSYKQQSFHYCKDDESRDISFSTKDTVNYYELDINFYNKNLRDNRGFVIGMVAYDKEDIVTISGPWFKIIVPIVIVLAVVLIIVYVIRRRRYRRAQQQHIQTQPMVVTGTAMPAAQGYPASIPSAYPVQNQQPYQQPPPYNPSVGLAPNAYPPNLPPVTAQSQGYPPYVQQPPPAYPDVYPPK